MVVPSVTATIAFNRRTLDDPHRRAFSSATEIESKRDEVRLVLPRMESEALFEASDDRLKIIDALRTARVLSTTERAIELLSAALAKRGANVTVNLKRVEVAALEKAAETGQSVITKFNLPCEHAAAKRAIDKLRTAIRAI